MNRFYFDASALGKRYAPEVGSPLIAHLFESVHPARLVMLTQSVGETLSILVRRRNRGLLTAEAYSAAYLALRSEIIAEGSVHLRTTDDSLVFASLPLIERHSINSTDAPVLRSALDTAELLRSAGHDLVLVASDARLVRAAAAEGLLTFNPESDEVSRLDALMAAG